MTTATNLNFNSHSSRQDCYRLIAKSNIFCQALRRAIKRTMPFLELGELHIQPYPELLAKRHLCCRTDDCTFHVGQSRLGRVLLRRIARAPLMLSRPAAFSPRTRPPHIPDCAKRAAVHMLYSCFLTHLSRPSLLFFRFQRFIISALLPYS